MIGGRLQEAQKGREVEPFELVSKVFGTHAWSKACNIERGRIASAHCRQDPKRKKDNLGKGKRKLSQKQREVIKGNKNCLALLC
jgi:hypothetical protein